MKHHSNIVYESVLFSMQHLKWDGECVMSSSEILDICLHKKDSKQNSKQKQNDLPDMQISYIFFINLLL